MIGKLIVCIFIQAIIYYMELNDDDKNYSKLAAGAAVVFFPYTIYQSYKTKKMATRIFKEAEVSQESIWEGLRSFVCVIGDLCRPNIC